MPLIWSDRVKETTSTIGTGAFALGGAATGFRAFSAVMANADTCYYSINVPGGADWEVGLGTYASGTNTLARTTILASANNGSAVNFPVGSKDIFITEPAAWVSTRAASGANSDITSLTGLTTALAVVAGTVSAPGLTASGDSNTGIFFPAADTIAFSEGGVEAMRITADGYVGIGTSTPAEPFHVAGSARFGASASQTTGTAVIYADGNNITIEAHAGDNFQVKRSLLLQTYGGNVGIGTETAPVTLTVSGSDAMLIPVGTTAQRPTGAAGYFRYNSTTGTFEGHNGTAWGGIGASGTVTSVALSGGTTGLTSTGGPVTTSGTFTLGGTLAIANGGTGATTAGAALTALGGLPLAGGTLTGPTVVSTNSTSDALRITQTGTGNALVVEDEANPDSSPFVVDASGNVGIGTSSPATGLQVSRGASEPATETGTLLVTGSTTAFRLAMGYSSASNAGWVQSVQNGVNVTPLLLNPLGGNVGIGTAAPAARFDLAGDYKEGVVTANTGTAYTINLGSGTVQILTLTGNCTFTFPSAATAGRSFMLFLRQDGTGGRTVTWPAAVRWPGGTAPTITSTASRTDKFIFTADGTNWLGSNGGQNYLA